MPRYRITYYKQYEVETDSGEKDALGIVDQNFANDIRETLFEQGGSRITDLFSFNVRKLKKKGVLKRKIAEKQ